MGACVGIKELQARQRQYEELEKQLQRIKLQSVQSKRESDAKLQSAQKQRETMSQQYEVKISKLEDELSKLRASIVRTPPTIESRIEKILKSDSQIRRIHDKVKKKLSKG